MVDMAHVKPVGKPETVAIAQAARAKPDPLNTEALTPEQAKADEDELMGSPLPGCPVVLDSGCGGYGLTANDSHFVSKKLSQDFRFTLGEGSKLSNTHIGSVQLYFWGPDGIQSFYFDNMALVPKATANILSEY
ncbi:unnamed protein product [Phytophthora fragariaefolia]|uniref:Unnamed protein product n=1 Tax=Phytophthora fragariaefolia TaxID=1490495 RepID=A0A9W7CJL9_9STRA|nr:unnamed protein product [Phytophthora fragariaefolia]